MAKIQWRTPAGVSGDPDRKSYADLTVLEDGNVTVTGTTSLGGKDGVKVVTSVTFDFTDVKPIEIKKLAAQYLYRYDEQAKLRAVMPHDDAAPWDKVKRSVKDWLNRQKAERVYNPVSVAKSAMNKMGADELSALMAEMQAKLAALQAK